MKTLVVRQNSTLSDLIGESFERASGTTVWADSGLTVKFPIPLEESNRRGTIWIDGKKTWKRTFGEICDLFPDSVRDLPLGTKADWGTGLYVENHDGFPMIMDAEWDTSD